MVLVMTDRDELPTAVYLRERVSNICTAAQH